MASNIVSNWEENMTKKLRNKWAQEDKLEAKRDVALAMLQEGFSFDLIGEITKLPLAEIVKLQGQRA